jgi:hypothetical protein
VALGEITLAWLGNFGTLPFFGPGDFPAWRADGALWEPTDAVRMPHFSHLSQPPKTTEKLRFYWGNEDESGLITFSMVEFDFPGPPPGFEQQYVGLDPGGPGKVELQVAVNVGPVVPGGPDQQYWNLDATAGDWLGYWQADTGDWVEWPDPPPSTPGRNWTYTMGRASASWWAVTAVFPIGVPGDCPPLHRPPWPYTTALSRIGLLADARRKLRGSRRVNGTTAQLEARVQVDLARLREIAQHFEPGGSGGAGLYAEALRVSADLARARADLARQQVNN